MKHLTFLSLFVFLTTNLFSQETGRFIDSRDNQIYSWINQSGQIWMNSNLNYKTDNSWCYGNDSTNCQLLGRLYNWESAKNSCPAGWHLPSVQEWIQLLNHYGGKDSAGMQLQYLNNNHPNTNSGFNALLAGGYLQNPEFIIDFTDLNEKAYFWTNTVELNLDDYAFVIYLTKNKTATGELSQSINRRFSVRCVKN